ncbi:MAG TPA: MotA/TolQ/ExbB proton channel family protein [Planctomycetota bacterium]|nr:MotA/TolQ/ExbB proton channel family protein [Planctomycetota bacterium]
MDALLDLFRAGGPVMLPIAAVSFAAWALAVLEGRRCADLLRGADAAAKLLVEQRGAPRGPAVGLPPVAAGELARARAGLLLLGGLTGLLPLLGLLGTVTGMLGTFDVLRLHGTGEPRLLAGGIREALITTEAGLLLALPVLVIHQILTARLRRAETSLDLLRHAVATGGGLAGDPSALAARLGFPQPLAPLERRLLRAVRGEAE